MAEFDQAFEADTAALPDGRYDAGIAAFERCLELRPEELLCTYHVAGTHALAGRADDAFAEVLERHMGLANPGPVFPGSSSSALNYPGLL